MDLAGVAARLGLRPDSLTITPLTGGVSSDIHLLDDGEIRVVAKRSIEKLRVAEDWPARPSRIWREADALRILGSLLPPNSVPKVYFEDREQFLYVMSAAPDAACNWKSRLLAGEIDPAIARRAGRVHRAFLQYTGSEFDDQTDFEDLRIDPYYRFTRERHHDLRAAFDRGIANLRTRRQGLVHGDWSPKNLLTARGAEFVWALDWECVHFGDPGFDTGFLLNHLLLKSFHQPAHYAPLRECALAYHHEVAALVPWADTIVHLPLLMLARMDGKSPVEYITDPGLKNRIRAFAIRLLNEPPADLSSLYEYLHPPR